MRFKIRTFFFILFGAFSTNVFPQTSFQPDFSYLFHSYPEGDKRDFKLGTSDSPKPYDVPVCVQNSFRKALKSEWDRLVGIESQMTKENEKSFPEKNQEHLKTWFGPIIRVDLPASFNHKQLYVLKIEEESIPRSRSWYLTVFDPKTNQCSSEPASIILNETFSYSFGDALGDDHKELLVQTTVRNGSAWKSIKRYYSVEKDLSPKEIYAYVDQYGGGGPENTTKNKKVHLSSDLIKKFDSASAEADFNSF